MDHQKHWLIKLKVKSESCEAISARYICTLGGECDRVFMSHTCDFDCCLRLCARSVIKLVLHMYDNTVQSFVDAVCVRTVYCPLDPDAEKTRRTQCVATWLSLVSS